MQKVSVRLMQNKMKNKPNMKEMILFDQVKPLMLVTTTNANDVDNEGELKTNSLYKRLFEFPFELEWCIYGTYVGCLSSF